MVSVRQKRNSTHAFLEAEGLASEDVRYISRMQFKRIAPGWRVRLIDRESGAPAFQLSFNDADYGGTKNALIAARMRRDAEFKKLHGRNISIFSVASRCQFQNSNVSILGLHISLGGKGAGVKWTSKKGDQGGFFSVAKYGFKVAMRKAYAALMEQVGTPCSEETLDNLDLEPGLRYIREHTELYPTNPDMHHITRVEPKEKGCYWLLRYQTLGVNFRFSDTVYAGSYWAMHAALQKREMMIRSKKYAKLTDPNVSRLKRTQEKPRSSNNTGMVGVTIGVAPRTKNDKLKIFATIFKDGVSSRMTRVVNPGEVREKLIEAYLWRAKQEGSSNDNFSDALLDPDRLRDWQNSTTIPFQYRKELSDLILKAIECRGLMVAQSI